MAHFISAEVAFNCIIQMPCWSCHQVNRAVVPPPYVSPVYGAYAPSGHILKQTKNEPSHDITNKMTMRPAKTQISLRICPVSSESSLSTWRKLRSLANHWAHSEDSDQTGRIPRLIWVFTGHTWHFVGFVMRRLKCNCSLGTPNPALRSLFR